MGHIINSNLLSNVSNLMIERERRGEGRRRDADVSAELHMNCVQAHECTQLFPISVLGDSIGQNTDIQEPTSISST